LVFFALYHFARLWLLSRRMKGQLTPEGYSLIRSSQVQSPCSFAHTIFLPLELEGRDAEMILRHEKAHIYHGHFLDVLANELMTRLLWFNPFMWLVRTELRNVHEFEADHDVLACGADINAYQTLLLAQVMACGNDFANGFTHSFIRRRFIEMKRSTAGTLGKIGKMGLVAWVGAMFCIFTFSECEPSANKQMTEEELRAALATIELDEPQMFVLDGTVDEAITDSCYNIYLSDELLHIEGGKPDTCVPVVDKRFTYSLPLKRLTAGRIRCIFPGGELCSAWIDVFFTPGDTLRLTVHDGYYSTDNTLTYNNNVKRWIDEMRRVTRCQSPEQPQVVGRRWNEVHCRRDVSTLSIKEVVFGADETVLHITSNDYRNGFTFPDTAFITDAAGNIYKYRRRLNETYNDKRLRNVFGAYCAFEPLPDTIISFDLHVPMRHPMTNYPFDNVIRDIHEVVANVSSGDQWYQAKAMPFHPSVDLGLSVKWATMNIGANNPEDYGDYFAWGETSAKETYSIANYKHVNPADSTLTKYCINAEYGKVDNRVLLDEIDDAAAANWGGNWRMPTFLEWSELFTVCTWESTTL
ncbi:MAG: M56 family metallopeptidase, partial [Bacteroidales bacterium]|nr:M56 family metallopeptidase [Bacteroidales bacterium]